jgi:hypothetical protein
MADGRHGRAGQPWVRTPCTAGCCWGAGSGLRIASGTAGATAQAQGRHQTNGEARRVCREDIGGGEDTLTAPIRLLKSSSFYHKKKISF